MTPRFFILGNGGAAIHAIKAIREAGYTGDLHQISDNSGQAFNPTVAPYYLSGKTKWDTCFPFSDKFIEEYKVIAHHGVRVISLDADLTTITTESGKVFYYDKCLIATGARPVMPPIPGLQESRYSLPLREPGTAQNMLESLHTASNVLVLGASFVGVKLAEVFLKKGINVVLADIAPQVMPQGAHKHAALHVENYLRLKGIDIKLTCSLNKVDEGPNGLYAAGDVCESFNRLSSAQQWMGTWGNACFQGRVAGTNMAGDSARFAGSIPQHVSPVFSWTYMQIGDALREGPRVTYQEDGDPFKGPYKITVFDNDVLVGANLINNPMDLARIKKEISRGLPASNM